MNISRGLSMLRRASVDLRDNTHEEVKALIYGKINEGKFKSLSDSLYSKYGVSGYQPREQPDNAEKQLEELNTAITRAGIRTGAAFIGMKQIQDRYQYERVPALSLAGKMGSDFTQNLMNAMAAREQMRMEYIQLASWVIQGTALSITLSSRFRDFTRALNRTPPTQWWSTLGRFFSGAHRTYRSTPPTAKRAIPWQVQLLLEGSAIAAPWIAERSVDALFRDRFNKAMINIFVGELIDAERVTQFHEGTRFIPGFGFEQIEDIQSRTSRYGATPEDLQRIAGGVQRSIPTGDVAGYTEQIFRESRFFGVDEGAMHGIYENLGRMGGGGREAETVTVEFERFFSALGQTFGPNVSHIALIEDLTQFAQDYTFSRKLVMDANALIDIQGFISRSDLGEYHTVAPTQQLVQGIDSALEGGASMNNIGMRRFASQYGISFQDMVHGVTSDSDVLNRFLGGLVQHVGIDDVEDQDQLIRLQRFTQSIGVDNDTLHTIIKVLPSFLRGDRVSAIDAGIGDSFSGQRTLDDELEILNILSNVSIDSVKTLSHNLDHISQIIDMQSQAAEAYLGAQVRVLAKIGELTTLSLEEMWSRLIDSKTSTYNTGRTNRARTGVVPLRGSYFDNWENVQRNYHGHMVASRQTAVENFMRSNPNARYVIEGARQLGIHPYDLAMLIQFETAGTFSPAARNPRSTATGLIQFIESVAQGMGTSTDALAAMSFEEQMYYVVRYMRTRGAEPGMTLGELYLKIIAPYADREIIYSGETARLNEILDLNKDEIITKTEIIQSFRATSVGNMGARGGRSTTIDMIDTPYIDHRRLVDDIVNEYNGGR